MCDIVKQLSESLIRAVLTALAANLFLQSAYFDQVHAVCLSE